MAERSGARSALPDDGRVLSALAELEVAQEELKVAEEELAEQRAQIEELLRQYDFGQRWRAQLFALLPVGVLVTDDDGGVQEANASAAAMLGVSSSHLLRKPFPVYVDPRHRRLVRDLLYQLARGAPDVRATVTLRPRHGEPVLVDLVALRDPASAEPLVRWLLLPQDAGPRGGSGPLHHEVTREDDDLRAATALAELCTLPVESDDQQRMLGQIALVVRTAVPSATAVSVTIGDPTAPDRLASDSVDAQRLDGLQLQLGEGPCVDAFAHGQLVVTPDLTTDARWPRLADAAGAQPLRGVLSLPIRVADERAGVVNVYGVEPGAFSARSVRVAEVVASAVAAVLRGVGERAALQSLARHLERALDSRAIIEQAKGILMAHQGGTADEAFARLVAFSSRQNVKLRDVAEAIVQGGGRAPLNAL